MKDFINNHRKLAAVLFVAVVIVLGIAVFVLTSSTKNVVTPFDPNTQTGDADAEAPINYTNMLYSITQSSTDPTKIVINAFSGYRNAAIDKIYQLGLNPTDFKITFTYESPFKNYE